MIEKVFSLRVKYAFLVVSLFLGIGLMSCDGNKKISEPKASTDFQGQICEDLSLQQNEIDSRLVENSDAEVPATYPGGEEALVNFIKKNIVFADPQKAKSYKGVIPVRFKVKENGDLGQFTLQETISPECDHALIEAVKKVKGFKAALDKEGKPLSAWWTINIEFPIH